MAANKPFVAVSNAMRGWIAVHYWWNPEGFHEPWETSIHSFRDQPSAEAHAKDWAKDLEIDYHPRSNQ